MGLLSPIACVTQSLPCHQTAPAAPCVESASFLAPGCLFLLQGLIFAPSFTPGSLVLATMGYWIRQRRAPVWWSFRVASVKMRWRRRSTGPKSAWSQLPSTMPPIPMLSTIVTPLRLSRRPGASSRTMTYICSAALPTGNTTHGQCYRCGYASGRHASVALCLRPVRRRAEVRSMWAEIAIATPIPALLSQ